MPEPTYAPQARAVSGVDRHAFAVHRDPVNLINSPQRCYGDAAFVRECAPRARPRYHFASVLSASFGLRSTVTTP